MDRLRNLSIRKTLIVLVLLPLTASGLFAAHSIYKIRQDGNLAAHEQQQFHKFVALKDIQTTLQLEIDVVNSWNDLSSNPNKGLAVAELSAIAALQVATNRAISDARKVLVDPQEQALLNLAEQELKHLRLSLEPDHDLQQESLDELNRVVETFKSTADFMVATHEGDWLIVDYLSLVPAVMAEEIIYLINILRGTYSTESQRVHLAILTSNTDEAFSKLFSLKLNDLSEEMKEQYNNTPLNGYRSRVMNQKHDTPLTPMELLGMMDSLKDLIDTSLEYREEVMVDFNAKSEQVRISSQREMYGVIIALGLVTVVTCGLPILVGIHLSKRLSEVSHTAKMLSQGNLGVLSKENTGSNEITVMSQALNDTSLTMAKSHDQLLAIAEARFDEPVLDEKLPGKIGETMAVVLRKLHASSAKLAEMAHHDQLTGLLDRQGLDEILSQIEPVYGVVMVVDLDGFKQVNDTHGHRAGDVVLVEVARRLEKITREGDTVARIGGDEFVIVMVDMHEQQVEMLASRARTSLAQPIMWNGIELDVGGSIGWGKLDEHTSFDAALDQADRAMYNDKHLRKKMQDQFIM